MMFLFTLLVASCYGDEVAVGFGNGGDGQTSWECLMGRCHFAHNPDSGHTHVATPFGGTGDVLAVGTCLILDCMEYFSDADVPRYYCEDEESWGCVPFVESVKRCNAYDGCEKNAKEWIGDKVCDLEKCGNCYGYWSQDVFDGGDCSESELRAAGVKVIKYPAPETTTTPAPTQPPGYTASQYGRICAGNLYLKGFKWMSKDNCEQQCDARSGCDTFCWSNQSPHWDCLLYTSCRSTSTRFDDGKSTSTYNCYKKPSAAETVTFTHEAAETVSTEDIAVWAFAILGLGATLHGAVQLVVPTKQRDAETAALV